MTNRGSLPYSEEIIEKVKIMKVHVQKKIFNLKNDSRDLITSINNNSIFFFCLHCTTPNERMKVKISNTNSRMADVLYLKINERANVERPIL